MTKSQLSTPRDSDIWFYKVQEANYSIIDLLQHYSVIIEAEAEAEAEIPRIKGCHEAAAILVIDIVKTDSTEQRNSTSALSHIHNTLHYDLRMMDLQKH